MKMNGFNFTNLFSSLGNNSGISGSINLGDYASIKNGSYGKLMKSYYAQNDPSSKVSAKDKTTKKKETSVDVDNTGLSQMKKESDGLKEAASKLKSSDLWKKTDGEYAKDKITNAVKDFVNNYNDVINQSSKVNSSEVDKSLGSMKSMTNTLSKSLSKVGISVEADGKLKLNEDSLNKADLNDVKTLFSGSTSYGSQIEDRASEISRSALMNSSFYSSNGTLSSAISGMFNGFM